MSKAYEKLVFHQLRLAVYRKGAAECIDDMAMTRAMTLNAKLEALGYVLNAADLLRIAASESLDGFYARIEELIDTVDADPMYPDFPKQVMEMPEAVFRFHQLVHYFSTYGLEELFGGEVRRGWMPDVRSTPKTKEDTRLLAAKVIELVDESDMYIEPARRILAKRERMTIPETEIICEAARQLDIGQLESLEIPFKENMILLAKAFFERGDGAGSVDVLRAIFQHTGDVLEFIAAMLRENRHHFRTSQKRMFVRLIERYPVQDWRANVILSNRKARRSLTVIDHLDYSLYSRSADHMAVVDALRDGVLKSWEGQARTLLESGADGALDFVAKRPGMLLRMTAWLVRMGYAPEEIIDRLARHAASLSVQTLVTVLNFFGSNAAEGRAEAEQVYEIMERTLAARLACACTPLRGKRVFLNDGGFDLSISTLKCSGKSAEGGYVGSGTVYKIPEDAKRVRFFVYWNDRSRVDVDLHCAATTCDGDRAYVGWNSAFRDCGAVYSGDITHSDAAEYIDIDLNSRLSRVAFNIHLYRGKPGFGSIETCFAGLQAVDSMGENVKLYNPANCFYSTHLRSDCRNMAFGYVDVENRTLVFDGIPLEDAPGEWYRLEEHKVGRMNIQRYLELLFEAQNCEIVSSEEEADVVLVVEKPMADHEISLIDNNYFMDA